MPTSRNRPKDQKKAARRARRNRQREAERLGARHTVINPLALLDSGRAPLEHAIARGLARGMGGLEPRRRIL